MVIKIGNRTIVCDEVKEESGRYYVWQGGKMIMSLANISAETIETEGGEVEHVPTPLEQARADLAERTAELQAKAAELQELSREYVEVLADDEAKRARLERIETLINGLGEVPTLSKLIQFVKDLKAIIAETGQESEVTNGEDQL